MVRIERYAHADVDRIPETAPSTEREGGSPAEPRSVYVPVRLNLYPHITLEKFVSGKIDFREFVTRGNGFRENTLEKVT